MTTPSVGGAVAGSKAEGAARKRVQGSDPDDPASRRTREFPEAAGAGRASPFPPPLVHRPNTGASFSVPSASTTTVHERAR
jgi:hypothetical protein